MANSLHWADVLACLAQVKNDALTEVVCLGLLDADLHHTWRVSTIYGNILRGQMNRVVETILCWDCKFTTSQKTEKSKATCSPDHGIVIAVRLAEKH